MSRKLKVPAREHIVLVGGPSNTFNGYFHFDENLGEDVAEPAPKDTSTAQILRYIQGDGTHPNHPTTTHDRYWANFIYSAVKLTELRHNAPEPGDILTLILYLPPYLLRQKWDWDASPYNLIEHRNSPWVRGKHPYDPTVQRDQQGAQAPPPPKRDPTKVVPPRPPPTYSPDEEDINHEILMRTTGEIDASGLPLADGGFPRRARRPDGHVAAIVDIPRRLVLGSRFGAYLPVSNVPTMFGVLTRLILARTVEEIYGYIESGAWTGERYMHILEARDEDDMANVKPIEECSWLSFGLLPQGASHPDWDDEPAVDRTRVRIKRFDYVGHSAPDSFFLSYGIQNKKGEVPVADVQITMTDFDSHLKKTLFTNDARAFLWGCYLGGDMAPMLTKYFKSIRACEGYTSYHRVLDAPSNLPEPDDPATTPWRTYP